MTFQDLVIAGYLVRGDDRDGMKFYQASEDYVVTVARRGTKPVELGRIAYAEVGYGACTCATFILTNGKEVLDLAVGFAVYRVKLERVA